MLAHTENKNDKNKSVFINFEYKENLLSFTITDEAKALILKTFPTQPTQTTKEISKKEYTL
jgi:hypothetical protein